MDKNGSCAHEPKEDQCEKLRQTQGSRSVMSPQFLHVRNRPTSERSQMLSVSTLCEGPLAESLRTQGATRKHPVLGELQDVREQAKGATKKASQAKHLGNTGLLGDERSSRAWSQSTAISLQKPGFSRANLRGSTLTTPACNTCSCACMSSAQTYMRRSCHILPQLVEDGT
eukprot:TRINITY_DN100961_c0_g1_i1.p2 TRINITY_DN100961_c0_g1~~TRINITY_DN100961_c0_g1_i1.p2  ORF type:complete len:171 (+),score=17.20 TRINITY_DN100961_c0_g1_i1:226-738(+)